FPVGIVVALAVCQEGKNLSNFTILNNRTQADIADVIEWNLYFKAAGFDLEEVELLYVEAYGTAADLLYDPYAVIGVNNLVSDLEAQMTIHESPEGDLRGNLLKHYKP